MTKAEYLQELKAHNWHWGFGSTNTIRKGRAKQQQLKALAAADADLKALWDAYEDFRWGRAEEPKIEESKPAAKASSYDRRAILWDAWKIARQAARRFGFPARAFIAEAMRQAWAKAKAKALNSRSEDAKTLFFICIDEKTGFNTRAVNLPLIDEVFTDRRQAEAALALLSRAFDRPYIKTSPYYRLH